MERATPDVETLVAELRARVEERRRQGAYPAGLEDRLDAQSRFLRHRRVHRRRPADAAGPLARARDALPFDRDRIPLGSDRAAGAAAHRLVAALVEHQTRGALDQIEAFARPVTEALAALAAAVEELEREVDTGLRPRLQAVLERQAVEESLAVQAAAHRARAGSAPYPGTDAGTAGADSSSRS